jgi:phosphate transport system substrate-binding protein
MRRHLMQTPRQGQQGRTGLKLLLLAGVLLAVCSLAFVACKSSKKTPEPTATSGAQTTPTETSSIDYGSLSGDVRIDGSSTVYPITEAVAEEFATVASGVHANVAFSGTGGGFELFCRGEIPLSDASRPIKQAETDACAANNITDIIEFQVAIDALTVMVNSSNDFVDCLTTDQLFKLFSDTSVKKWSDIDPSWPSDGIKFYYPGTESGTFDYFVESIITKKDANATHRGDGTASEDDNVLAVGIENDDKAIGYFGFAYYQEAGSRLKAVAIDSGNGCVEPTFENAVNGSYTPLSRPLFIYTRESLLRDKPQLLGFVKFYLDNTPTLVPDVGYVTMPDALLQEQETKLAPFLP